METQAWPGYVTKAVEITAPGWVDFEIEDRTRSQFGYQVGVRLQEGLDASGGDLAEGAVPDGLHEGVEGVRPVEGGPAHELEGRLAVGGLLQLPGGSLEPQVAVGRAGSGMRRFSSSHHASRFAISFSKPKRPGR